MCAFGRGNGIGKWLEGLFWVVECSDERKWCDVLGEHVKGCEEKGEEKVYLVYEEWDDLMLRGVGEVVIEDGLQCGKVIGAKEEGNVFSAYCFL